MSSIFDPTPNEKAALNALEEHAKRIDRIFKESPKVSAFKINGPRQLPVKSRFGQYTTQNFRGDEKLIPSTAYLGKRGHIVYGFTPAEPQKYAFVEVTSDKAADQLIGFKAWLDERLDVDEDELLENLKAAREKAAREEKDRLEHEQANNPVFGSW